MQALSCDRSRGGWLASVLIGAALTFAVPAEAAREIASPPLYVPSSQYNQCILVNSGTRPGTADALLLQGQNGALLASSSGSTITLQPGQFLTIGAIGGGVSFCRVIGGAPRGWNLTHCAHETTGNASPCIGVTTAP